MHRFAKQTAQALSQGDESDACPETIVHRKHEFY